MAAIVHFSFFEGFYYYRLIVQLTVQVISFYPTFKVGQTLTGIIADWSDQQVIGLIKTVGKNTADNILKVVK